MRSAACFRTLHQSVADQRWSAFVSFPCQIAKQIHSNLRSNLSSSEKSAVVPEGAAKFTFNFADADTVEKGTMNDRLGLPSANIEEVSAVLLW